MCSFIAIYIRESAVVSIENFFFWGWNLRFRITWHSNDANVFSLEEY